MASASEIRYSPRMWKRWAKRCFDVVSTAIALLFLSPVFLLLAVLVRLKLGSPVLFRQERPGLNSKPFLMYKFRTMTDERDSTGQLRADSERLTHFGSWLRRTSLDELPELVNVLRGHMSLVGPRPLLTQYVERYTKAQGRRHEVLPGITGLAQVKGRNSLSWNSKFRYDVWYVDHHSFALDLWLLFATISKTIKREGINQDGHATAPEFMGSSVHNGRTR